MRHDLPIRYIAHLWRWWNCNNKRYEIGVPTIMPFNARTAHAGTEHHAVNSIADVAVSCISWLGLRVRFRIWHTSYNSTGETQRNKSVGKYRMPLVAKETESIQQTRTSNRILAYLFLISISKFADVLDMFPYLFPLFERNNWKHMRSDDMT